MWSPKRWRAAAGVALLALAGCAADTRDDLLSTDVSDASVEALDVSLLDAPVIDVPPADHRSPLDAPALDAPALDAPALDALTPMDSSVIVPGCDPVPGSSASVRFEAIAPVAPGRLIVHLYGPDPWANLDLGLRSTSGATLSPVWNGVTEHYHWQWIIDPTAPGDYCVSVRTDPSGALRWRGPLRITGVAPPPDAGPPDTGPIPTGIFVTRSGTELMVGSRRLRFVGVNLRGLPHYGSAPLRYASLGQIETELDEVRRMGAVGVRVFAAANDADPATVAARLARVLDGALSRGLYVIVALTDFYLTGLSPRGDDSAYTDSYMGLRLLGRDFFASGYRANYLPWVRAVVTRFRDHPAVLAWELGNELKCDADHGAFLRFAADVGATIRAIAPRHLIASGMITSRWLSDAEARALYSQPTMDLVTLHDYDASHAFADFERAVASDTGRPLIVEEAGFDSGDRASRADADLRYYVDARGARGYLQWGFTVIVPDNGNGDRQFGMDHLAHASDYDSLFRTYQSAAARIR